MKILITGGCGFIGTNLIPRLIVEGHQVFVIDNLSHGSYIEDVHGKCEFEQIDIRDKKQLKFAVATFQPDVTFHFAGLVSIYDCHRDPSAAVSNNITGSVNLFDVLIECGCPRVIFAETSAVYEGCNLPAAGYNELQSDPVTIYSTTKASVALLAESYSRTKGLQFTALRYFNVAGPIQDYNRTVPPLFAGFALRMIGANNPIIFGDGNRRRDFIHVDDVNDFHLLCLNDIRTVNETYNLGTGKSHSLFEIGKIVKDTLVELQLFSELKEIEYDFKPEINGEAFEIFANIEKAKSIGWCPKKTMHDAMKDTIVYLLTEIKRGAINPFTYMNNLNTDSVKIG